MSQTRYASINLDEIQVKNKVQAKKGLKFFKRNLNLEERDLADAENISDVKEGEYRQKDLIVVDKLLKKFGEITALDSVSFTIPAGSIYGLVGSNGAGKSTFMRIVAGVLKEDYGKVRFKGMPIYDNPEAKREIVLVADNPWFFANAHLEEMKRFYKNIYPNFSQDLYNELLKIFPLNPKMKLKNMSKGMQRQAALLLGLASRPSLILMDEAFDGLDPVMRNVLKRLVAREVASGDMTVIIASHNLRELEDFCDRVSLLHKGGLLCEKDLDELKLGVFKLQTAFHEPPSEEELKEAGLDILRYDSQKSVLRMLVKGKFEDIEEILAKFSPLVSDILPLSLEEFFVYELGEIGYGIEEITGE